MRWLLGSTGARRAVAAVGVVVATVVVSGGASGAQTCVGYDTVGPGGEPIALYDCGGSVQYGGEPGLPPGPDGGPPDPGSVHYYPMLGTGGPTGRCIYWHVAPGPPTPGQTLAAAVGLAALLAQGYELCPGLGEPSAEDYALGWWRQQVLPAPVPVLQPGEMLVGWPAYLENNDPMTLMLREDGTPFGSLVVSARSTLAVDWGDGTITGPFDFAGAPWPDGRITHVYQQHGTYDVEVTQTWTGSWRLGVARGTFPPLITRGRLDEFPVREVQAVITG
jgi:hypothetical protein